MNHFKRLTLIGIILFALFGCQGKIQENNEQPILYTSIYPIEFVVEKLTADFAATTAIFPPGVDAHTYEPTIKDILALADGVAFFYLGESMEGSADKISNALNNTDVQLVELSTYDELFIEAATDHDHHGHSHGDYDPHFWFDPERMIILSEILKDILSELFPEEEETITNNFETLSEGLNQLDAQYTEQLSEVNNPYIIVSHAAYGYWEMKYGIKQIPISGVLSTDEPSQQALAHLVDLANTEQISYVLFEQSTSNRLATIVQEELTADALYIHNLETLLPTDLQAKEDYFTLMEKNLEVLIQATK